MAQTSADRALDAIRALGEELGRLVEPDYYSDDDLRLAKKFERTSDHYLFESSSSAAGLLADFWSSADLDYFRGYGDAIDRQDRASIDRYVQSYIKGKPMVVAVLVPQDGWAKMAAPLQAALGAWRIP
jgi:zinc protease